MKLPVLMSIVVATMSAGSAAAANDFRTLIFEKDLNVPAEVAWHKIGGFCQFPELVGATCAMNSGTGGVGSAVAFHAACNLFSAYLTRGYFPE